MRKLTNERVNMAAHVPTAAKDKNGDAWGTKWSDTPNVVYLDRGGVVRFTTSWECDLKHHWPLSA